MILLAQTKYYDIVNRNKQSNDHQCVSLTISEQP
jgi:hypothetical protein